MAPNPSNSSNLEQLVLKGLKAILHHAVTQRLHWLHVQQRIDYKVALLDVQGPQHIDAVVPSTHDQGPGARPQPTIHHHIVVSTIAKDDVCEARFPLLSACHLELAPEDSHR